MVVSFLKRLVAFDIRKFTKDPVKTGILPIGPVGPGAIKAAGITGKVLKGAAKIFLPKTALGIGAGIFGTGILIVSPTARKAVIQLPKTLLTGGQFIGEKIEELPEAIEEKAGKFGLAGLSIAALAGLVGGLIAGKRGLPGIPGLPGAPGKPAAESFAVMPTQVSPTTEPIGVVQPTKAPEAPAPTGPLISNKIIFKPEINISFRKSRKFINQQLLIR